MFGNSFQKNKSKKNKSKSKMFFLIGVISALSALLIWRFYVDNVAKYDVTINPSNNVSFHGQKPIALNYKGLDQELYSQKASLNFIYFYSTWCKSCYKNFSIINEIAREFQNTKLNFVAVAIDKDIDSLKLQEYLKKYSNIYFRPFYLENRDDFKEFLHKNNINYKGRVPFLAIIDNKKNLVISYSGLRSLSYLRKKIIENLYLK